MKTILIPEKGRAVFDDMPKPNCSETGILIKTLYSGLSNGTERNFLVGGNYGKGFPRHPGYQILGEIVECGTRVSKFKVGDIVFCANTGYGHWEYLPAEEDSLLVKMKPDDDLAAMSLLAIASVAYRNAMRLQIEKGDKVLVFGGAVIGQIAGQVAQNCGAKVTLVAGSPDKLKAAVSSGFRILDRNSADFNQQLEAGKPWDAAMETSGADVLDTIIGVGWGNGLLAYEGRLALVAGRDKVTYDSNAAQGSALLTFQSAHFKQHHLDTVTEEVRKGSLKLRSLITREVSIDKAPTIYEQLYKAPSSLFGTVFKW